jgi:hypothetical protein
MARSVVLLALLFVLHAAQAVVLDPPVVHCASVDVAGGVTLTWSPPADPGGDFLRYEIYRANDAAGPFAQVATVPVYGQTTFLDLAANANGGARFYYLLTVSTSPPPNTSESSDTLSTLFLEVFQSAPLGSANLAWNAPAPSAGAVPQFTVWMEYPVGNWEQIAEVPTTNFSYQHVITVCEDSLTFRIGLADAQGCVSFSNLDGEIFADVTPPTAPFINTVSVDTLTGQATISWEPSPEGDTDGYIILLVTPGGGILIDTIYGQNNTEYTWDLSTADLSPESFTVAAFDTCQVGVPPSPNTSATRPAHTSMHLSNTYDRCSSQVFLTWTPYVGWPVGAQRVYVSTNGGPWALLTTLAGTAGSYVHQAQPFRTYCYAVRADELEGQRHSLSNKSCRATLYPAAPSFNYLRTVTVSGPSAITIVDSVDMSASARRYVLERSDAGGPYEEIAVLPGTSGPVITFVDEDVDPSRVGYRYRMLVEDSCGAEAVVSNVGGNIVLRATPELQGRNVLNWNGYASWAGITGSHHIHRSVSDEPYDLFAVVPEQPWTFADEVQDLTGSTGRFCYRVEARETGNPSGINAISVSNVSCAVQEDLVFIPNAFTVGGLNPIFKPVLSYVDVSQYELGIINRWGQVVWTSNDPERGWDGIIGSGFAQTGVYGYYCTFKNGAGRRFEKRGTVTLLKGFE